jgi:hypothetical protein
MPVSEKTFLQLALEEPNQWELHCGEHVVVDLDALFARMC